MATSILKVINWLLPKDRGSVRVGRDIAYGEHRRQKLDIYAPRGAQGALPVVMFIYGGSWSGGDKSDYSFVGRGLAAAGFIAVIADYRLVPEIEYPAFLDDCASARRWVRQNIAGHGGDPVRFALAGHSAGAYNAAMLALHPQFADAGALAGVACLSGPFDFVPLDGPISLRVFGAAEDLVDTQPITHAGDDSPAFWLAHGDKDTLVYPRNSVAMGQKLRDAGVPAETVRYPELGHPGTLMALALPLRGRASVYADMIAFLRRRLVG